MNGYFEQNDPVFFSPQLGLVFPTTGLHIEGQITTGKIFAVLPRSAYAKLSTEKKLLVDKYVLTKAKAETYAGLFKRQAEQSAIPWIFGPASLIPGIGAAITIATSTVDGLSRLAASKSVSANQLVVLMAEGGAFVKTWSLERNLQHGELLVTMVFYNVMVGSENRMFGIYSSKHALTVRG
jgi:hypothetical protein